MIRSNRAVAAVETLVPATSKDLRVDALERLYSRRDTVVELIRLLEQYQSDERDDERRLAPCIPINTSPQWS